MSLWVGREKGEAEGREGYEERRERSEMGKQTHKETKFSRSGGSNNHSEVCVGS